jgi:hypothetical protein
MIYRLFFFLICMPIISLAQDDFEFEEGASGMGFYVGFNYNQLKISVSENPFYDGDTLVSAEAVSKIGYSLGMIFNFPISEQLTLKFTPGLNFFANQIVYDLRNGQDHTENLKLTMFPVPMQLNIYPTAAHNFYFFAGGKYSLIIGNADNTSLHLLEYRKNDFAVTGGLGFEIETQSNFTIGAEAIYSYGFSNLLKPSAQIYNQSLKSMKFHTISILINFM